MIRLMVNADDFGWDENRTKAILEAYRQGIVTTTTAMVNMPWFEKAIDIAKGTGLFPNIGLHLCLTEGFPLTKGVKADAARIQGQPKCPRQILRRGCFCARVASGYHI